MREELRGVVIRGKEDSRRGEWGGKWEGSVAKVMVETKPKKKYNF